MNALLRPVAGALALAGLAGLVTGGAQASVVSFQPKSALSNTPVIVDFGQGVRFSFTAASTGNGPGAAVQSSGTNLVTSFFGGVTDFEAGASIDQNGELYGFSAFPRSALIPDSPADDFIGLDFRLADGLHFGYAEVAGAALVSYGYNTAPNTSIATGAVPEPASMALLLVGAAGVVATRRRRKS